MPAAILPLALLLPVGLDTRLPPDAAPAPAAAAAEDEPRQLPYELRSMLEAAMASGNEGDVATIVRYAKTVWPGLERETAALTARWNKERRDKATRALQTSSFGSLIKGRAELGGFFTTGNTENVGVTGVLDLSREGYWWRHRLRLQADYQESAGVTTREHYLAAFEPNYKVDDRLYIYGAAQYESDRYLGYFNRYSASSGAGYTAVRNGRVTLDLELGPAFRHTQFTDQTIESNLAARGRVDFDWKLNPALTFRQDASAYVQDANSTVSSTTALDAKLFGPLSARLSYVVQYESMPPEGRVNTDTTGRAALVYAF